MKLLLVFASVAYLAAVFSKDTQPDIVIINGGLNGTGITTRYWDCCKPSCSWTGNLKDNTSTPVQSCAVDGVTVLDVDAPSGCADNGTAYMCSNQVAWQVNSTLAYGFAAASFTGGADVQQCCSCFLLSFLEKLAGKQLLVQVTNTGGDLNLNQFDLAFPGGGVGLFTQGCVSQWNTTTNGWGERYGGLTNETQCSEMPAQLQSACKLRFEYMENVSNPNITFTQVRCPKELTDLSGCLSPV